MGISAVEVPATERKSKYNYTAEDAKTALEMLAALKENENAPAPGDGPFATEGEARSAANIMMTRLGASGKEVGVRVFPKGETKTETREKKTKDGKTKKYKVEVGEFYFALKNGRRKAPEKNGSTPEGP